MAVDERSRRRPYERLEEILGGEEAQTLMAFLPPQNPEDIATKYDVAILEQKLMAQLRAELLAQTRTIMFTLSAAVITVGGLAFAAARLV